MIYCMLILEIIVVIQHINRIGFMVKVWMLFFVSMMMLMMRMELIILLVKAG